MNKIRPDGSGPVIGRMVILFGERHVYERTPHLGTILRKMKRYEWIP